MTVELSAEQIKANLHALMAERREQEKQEEKAEVNARFRYIRPLSDAAGELIEYLQNPEGRFMLGLPEIDMMTRGFGAGELVYVLGHAHSGKTQIILNAINNNRGLHVLYFTPDEPAALVLTKLVALSTGVDAETLEAKIKDGDKIAEDLVRETASRTFKNLIVVDTGLTVNEMASAYAEYETYYGCPPDLVVVDFLELIPGEETDGLMTKSRDLKKWAKDAACPVICLHQASRTSGGRGRPMGMFSGRYGGETDAIFVLGVYRRRDDDDLDQFDRDRAENLISVQVIKNKRPPNRTGEHEYFMEGATGNVREIRDGDFGAFRHASTAVRESIGYRAEVQQSIPGTNGFSGG